MVELREYAKRAREVLKRAMLVPLRFSPDANNKEDDMRRCFLNFLITSAVLFLAASAYAAGPIETIDAQARGTSTEMGTNIGIQLTINRWSTDEDYEVLRNAFLKGQTAGLAQAMEKMKAVGRIRITGTLGYDVAFVEQIQSPKGRLIRFVANRQIELEEAYHDTRSQKYRLTAGEISIDNQDYNKSVGVLYPAAQLVINADGELQLELWKNPWRLTNIIDWNAKEK